jgi:hypothetical protein
LRRQRVADRREELRVLLRRAEARDQQREARLQLVLLRHEGRGRRAQAGDQRAHVLGQRDHGVAREAQRVDALVDAPEEQPQLRERVDLVQVELELGHHAEVAAAPTDRPEQVGVLVGRGGDDAPVGEHHVGRHEVVAAPARRGRSASRSRRRA